jgi:hypothetical protein
MLLVRHLFRSTTAQTGNGQNVNKKVGMLRADDMPTIRSKVQEANVHLLLSFRSFLTAHDLT